MESTAISFIMNLEMSHYYSLICLIWQMINWLVVSDVGRGLSFCLPWIHLE